MAEAVHGANQLIRGGWRFGALLKDTDDIERDRYRGRTGAYFLWSDSIDCDSDGYQETSGLHLS